MARKLLVVLCVMIAPFAAQAGPNGKLTLFGGVQHVAGVGGFYNPFGWPDPLWKPIAQGPATGNKLPANWYRDDYSLNDFAGFPMGVTQFQSWLRTLTNYLGANNINGPCIQLFYPNPGGSPNGDQIGLASYISYLQALAPYIKPGTYLISCNETCRTNGVEPSQVLLNALGGAGATGYDGLIALVKLQRQYLPAGVLLGLNEYGVCSFEGNPGNSNAYFQSNCLNIYRILANHGAALDWLGCQGYMEEVNPDNGSTIAALANALNTVGSQLVTTKGTGAPNTIAFTEFTPGNYGWKEHGKQITGWQAYLSLFASNRYVFGVTGPWKGFRRSNGFSAVDWFYDDTDKGGEDPDGVATSNGHVTPTLTWLQGYIPTIVAAASNPTPTPGPTRTPTPAPAQLADAFITFAGGGQLSDPAGNVWTISNGVVLKNSANAGYSANVIELARVGGVIWQENTSGFWWSWTGTAWASGTPF